MNDKSLSFVVYVHPEPQGSAKGFVVKGRAIITSANAKLKPFRSEVTRVAIGAVLNVAAFTPLFGKHEPVSLAMDFYFHRPPSIPKKRTAHVVKPDLDKLLRAATDALTGVIYKDDAQVVIGRVSKHYTDQAERVEIGVCGA